MRRKAEPEATSSSPERASAPTEELHALRRAIDGIDGELLAALGRRLRLCAEVAALKKANHIPMMQPSRVEEVKAARAGAAPRYGLRPDFVRRLYVMIIEEACALEDDIIEDREGA